MKFLRFVLLHLRRTWIRTGSTLVALGLCVFLVCALRSVLAEVDSYVETRSPRRLIVSNLISGGLPVAHGERIARVDGVRRVAAGFMFVGFLQKKTEGKADPGAGVSTDWATFFHNMAVEAEPYFGMNPEFRIAPEEFRAFLGDRQGCLVGRKLADKFGWRLGDRFSLQSIAPALQKPDGPFEFVVRGYIDPDLENFPGTPVDVMFFHLKYLLKTIGFTSVQVMALIVLEGVLLGALGGLLGLSGTSLFLWALNRMPGVMLPGLAQVTLRPEVAALAFGVAVLPRC